MDRCQFQRMGHFCLIVVANVLLVALSAAAQTPIMPPSKVIIPAKPVAKTPVAVPAKPVAKTPVAIPTTPATTNAVMKPAVAKTVATPATTNAVPAQAATPVSTSAQPAVSGTTAVQNALSGAGTASQTLSQQIPGSQTSPLNAYSSGGSTPTDGRAPVTGQGVGNFLWPGGWTLTAYGCFRTGTRLFCDFDTTNQNNMQANSSIWSGAGGVNVVDDGGKITQRHNAFFVGSDGSQFQTAYIGPQPVRFIIEYDDIDQRYTTVSLVLTNNRIQSVPIVTMDPSLPAGQMPDRTKAFAGSQQPSTSQPTGSNPMDKATSVVNNVNTQKNNATNLWKSVQSTVQPH